MKRKSRVLVTTKILAVALTATVGCATAGAPTSSSPENVSAPSVAVQGPERPAAEAPSAQAGAANEGASAPAPAATAAPVTTAVQAATFVQAPAPQAAKSAEDDPALLALRSEMASAGRDKAMVRVSHFRPLCDKDGYPLVGNLARKGPTFGPAAFCATVRERAGGH